MELLNGMQCQLNGKLNEINVAIRKKKTTTTTTKKYVDLPDSKRNSVNGSRALWHNQRHGQSVDDGNSTVDIH